MDGQTGHPYGLHRVLAPERVLPQPAWKLDAESDLYDNELLIAVERLNIDSASFMQMREECRDDVNKIKQCILEIVAERGKMQNPVTGSGGMLIGTVEKTGPRYPHRHVRPGMKIATLVSLTLTPLKLEQINRVHLETGQVDVKGKAVLFASGPFAILPDDLPEAVALAALDVAGAPAQTARLIRGRERIVVMGAGGKSGLLSLCQAWKKAGTNGQVIALESRAEACAEIRQLGLAHQVLEVDATDPLAVYEAVSGATAGEMADLTLNCVNVPGTELPSILATRDGGTIYFFSMAVRFTTAALGAEGIGKDVQMMIGNGYAPGHAKLTLQTLRECPPLLELFRKRYGSC
ncbi:MULTISPECIES: L-erythro-3,5-diaminohexanoate dehydrogenase [Thermoactinomyces]|uniref:L-erythro-3,5-diaminohexanoate dehydrogenase n=1 Tax=Thermoactinomyces TaxID=2023 RepID=UPI001E5A3610|nr:MULTISPECIES: L-erythro-3,5-diaminohexanoate dehydrogenase [Thermoactinomyces]